MTMYKEAIQELIGILVSESPSDYEIINLNLSSSCSREVLRGLMNLRKPKALSKRLLALQDYVLKAELDKSMTIGLSNITSTSISRVGVLRGDITKIECDAIVNPAKSNFLGCFVPGHRCVDNDIHSASGLQLRNECYAKAGNHDAKSGDFIVTGAYNLPCNNVVHVIGPSFRGRPTKKDIQTLAGCYTEILSLALKIGWKSICFPAIAVGQTGFTPKTAAKIAVNAIEEFVNENPNKIAIIFCLKSEEDYQAYEELLQ